MLVTIASLVTISLPRNTMAVPTCQFWLCQAVPHEFRYTHSTFRLLTLRNMTVAEPAGRLRLSIRFAPGILRHAVIGLWGSREGGEDARAALLRIGLPCQVSRHLLPRRRDPYPCRCCIDRTHGACDGRLSPSHFFLECRRVPYSAPHSDEDHERWAKGPHIEQDGR